MNSDNITDEQICRCEIPEITLGLVCELVYSLLENRLLTGGHGFGCVHIKSLIVGF